MVDFCANAIEQSNATVKAKGMWERPITTENAAPFDSIWVSNPPSLSSNSDKSDKYSKDYRANRLWYPGTKSMMPKMVCFGLFC